MAIRDDDHYTAGRNDARDGKLPRVYLIGDPHREAYNDGYKIGRQLAETRHMVKVSRGYGQTAVHMNLTVREIRFLTGMTDAELVNLGYQGVLVVVDGQWSEIRHTNWTIVSDWESALSS